MKWEATFTYTAPGEFPEPLSSKHVIVAADFAAACKTAQTLDRVMTLGLDQQIAGLVRVQPPVPA